MKQTMAIIARMSFSVILALMPALPAGAASPYELNYQGKLTDSTGNPRTGTHSVRFRIYDASAGGTLLFDETHPSTAVTGGVFSLRVGAVIGGVPGSVFQGGADRWLEITVDGDVMTPRQRLVASPYALAVATGSVTNAEISNSADISGLGVADFASANISQWTNDAGYVTTAGIWSQSGANPYYNTGNVGVGTTNPTTALQVVGNVNASGDITAATMSNVYVQQEVVIWRISPIGVLGDGVNQASTTIDLQQPAIGYPSNIKAVNCRISRSDSVTNIHGVLRRSSADLGTILARTQNAGIWSDDGGVVNVDGNGDIYYGTNSVSGNIYLVCTGYWR